MLSILLISFREFLEAWLLVGLFLGLSKQLQLGRTREIFAAVALGMVISLAIPSIVFFAGGHLRALWSDTNVDLIQGIVMVFIAGVIAVVALSLHRLASHKRRAIVEKIKDDLRLRKFNTALFIIITLCIIREGLEVGLFSLSVVLVLPAHTLFLGLIIGFLCAACIGVLVMFASKLVSVRRIYMIVEYGLMFVGAALFKNGLSHIFLAGFNIDLGTIVPLSLPLPNSETSIIGHIFNNLFGIEADMSLVKILILAGYIGLVYYFVFSKRSQSKNS